MEFRSNANYNQDVNEGTVFVYTGKDLNKLHLSVNIHHYVGCGDAWYLTCPDLQISMRDLKTDDFDEAVKNAQEYIKSYMKVLNDKTKEFYNDKTKIKRVR